MAKPPIIVTLGFKRPAEREGLAALARYLQFRDGSLRREAYLLDGRYPAALSDAGETLRRDAKWVDRGLGEGYAEVVRRAEARQGRRTLARTWVVAPDPALMQHVPAGQRAALVARVSERLVERWYDDNGWGQPEFSYVVHDKVSAQGLPMPHAHLITPGTVQLEGLEGPVRLEHIVRRPHIRDLHATARQTMIQELERVLGRERAQELLGRGAPERDTLSRIRLAGARLRAGRLPRRGEELKLLARYVNRSRAERQRAERLGRRLAGQREQAAQLAAERLSLRERLHRQEEAERAARAAALSAARERERGRSR